jgi:hypothetical protein
VIELAPYRAIRHAYAVRCGKIKREEDRMSKTAQRTLGVLGIVFFVMQVVVLVLPAPPTPNSSTADTLSWYQTNRSAFLVLNYIGAVSMPLALILIGGLTQIFRRAEGPDGWLHFVFLASATANIALGLVLFLLFQQNGVYRGTGEAFQFGVALTNLMWSFFLITAIPMFAVSGWIITRRRALPVWLGYIAYVGVVASLVASVGAVVTSGPLASGDIVSLAAFGLFAIWLLLVAIVLLVRPRDIAPATA